MLINSKICSFSVSGATYDEMYMKALKKIGKLNALDYDKYKPTYEFIKKESEGLNTLEINVYLKIDATDVEERHCKLCRDAHTSFFINSRYNCDRCEYLSFKKRMEEKIKEVRSFGKNVAKAQLVIKKDKNI